MSYEVIRSHSICCGHKVTGHEGKCIHLHGHNYRFEFHVRANNVLGDNLDSIGRVIDFSVVKTTLCQWLEEKLDHKFLIFKDDPIARHLKALDKDGVILVDFNPTAENIAEYIVETVAPYQLRGLGVELHKLVLWETDKCGVTYTCQ